ncbi:MAG TPA: molybdenum cofactor guanylyltransferase [Pyrinomonadaceae bacterium]|jgi:molybdopterin-guanine dinucleotide biosynthesis protein A
MSEIEGFILIGGKSSRMGTNKAKLRLGEQSFVQKIAAALASISVRVRMVGGETSAEAQEIVPDVYGEWGALGGLHAALDACQSPWAAIVACDLPFVTEQLFRRLAALRENYEAVVPVQNDGRLQPLCALYSVSACLSRTEELIAAGERRPRILLERIRARRVAPSELADLTRADRFFINVNTPEDYRQAKALLSNE